MEEVSEEVGRMVEEKLSIISSKRDVDRERLTAEFMEICSSKNLETYPMDDRVSYAARVLWARYMSVEPTKPYNVIPYGVREPQRTKSGWLSEVYVLVEEGFGFQKKNIVCRGESSGLAESVELFVMYKNVALNDRGSFLEASVTTKFDTPNEIAGVDEMTLLQKQCGFPLLKLSEMVTNRTRLDGGYPDREDMKLIRGIVVRVGKGKRKDGSSYGVYEIVDDTIGGEQQIIEVDGEKVVIPTKVTVWCPQRFVRFDRDSELLFVGTVEIGRKDRMPFMNAYACIPNGIVIELGGE